MRNLKYFLITTVLLFTIPIINAADNEGGTLQINDTYLQLRITDLQESEAPFIVDNSIVFTYKPQRSGVRHVGVSFEHENFSRIHSFYKNVHDVFFYIYEYPMKDRINYKFVEDGIWITDKNSSLTKVDRNFIKLSSFIIPDAYKKQKTSPIIEGNSITFKLEESSNNDIYITGDFNNWNPFLYRMHEISAGNYQLNLNLPPGRYGYYYIIDGKRVTDPENRNIGYSNLGEKVSLLVVE